MSIVTTTAIRTCRNCGDLLDPMDYCRFCVQAGSLCAYHASEKRRYLNFCDENCYFSFRKAEIKRANAQKESDHAD